MVSDIVAWYGSLWVDQVPGNWFWILPVTFVLGLSFMIFEVLVTEHCAPDEVPGALLIVLMASAVFTVLWPALLPLGLIGSFVGGLTWGLGALVDAKKARKMAEERHARMAAAKARNEPVQLPSAKLIEPLSDEDMFCSCPKCGMAGLHTISPTDTGRVRRDCTFCTYVWFTGTPGPKEIPAGDRDRWGD